MKKSYERETELWNQVFAECKPVDLRELTLSVEPMFDEALKMFADSTMRVLDFGCGTGDISFQYLQFRPENKVVGIDMSETGIDFAVRTAELSGYKNVHFLQGGDELLKVYKENEFDGIILSNVLDVMPEGIAETVVKDLDRILKPGGLWFIKLNPYYSKEELEFMGYHKVGYNIYEEDKIMRLRQASTNYWKSKFTALGEEKIYLEFEYPWQEGLNRLFVYKSGKTDYDI